MAIFNSTAPCPYCYTEINPKKLAYRCSGRNQSDKSPCAKVPDAVRQRYFADSDPYRPVVMPIGSSRAPCQSCGATPGPGMCPVCHSLLPAEFSSAHLQVAVVGDFNVGKSTYLAAIDGSMQELAAAFGASCHPGDGPGNRDLRCTWGYVESGGLLPPQTSLDDGFHSPAVYSWRSTDGRRTRSALISFCDYSGSNFVRGEPSDSNPALEYVAVSTGIILVLDPFTFKSNASSRDARGLREPYFDDAGEKIVRNAARAVRQSLGLKPAKAISVPLACVVAKMDAFAEQPPAIDDGGKGEASTSAARWVPHRSGQIRTRLREWGAGSIVQSIEAEFSKVQYFGVSALGSEPDYPSARLSAQPAQPSGVLDPLIWLMADKGLVQSKHLDQNLTESA